MKQIDSIRKLKVTKRHNAEAKHTPGPWSVTEHNGEFLLTKDTPPMIGDPVPVGAAYTEANARLIAAAPTMLAELRRDLAYVLMMKQLLVALRQTETVQYEFTEMREAAIRAAIAKAEGR